MDFMLQALENIFSSLKNLEVSLGFVQFLFQQKRLGVVGEFFPRE